MNTHQKNRLRYQGIACALSTLHRLHDEPTFVCDVLRSLGITLDELRSAGADDYDLETIIACLRQGGPVERAQAEA